jgi:hypothetical protein
LLRIGGHHSGNSNTSVRRRGLRPRQVRPGTKRTGPALFSLSSCRCGRLRRRITKSRRRLRSRPATLWSLRAEPLETARLSNHTIHASEFCVQLVLAGAFATPHRHAACDGLPLAPCLPSTPLSHLFTERSACSQCLRFATSPTASPVPMNRAHPYVGGGNQH